MFYWASAVFLCVRANACIHEYFSGDVSQCKTQVTLTRSNMDDCTSEVMLRCMHVPSITAAGQ